MPAATKPEPPKTWRERLAALRNLPPLMKMVWETSPALTTSTLLLRCVKAVAPVANLLIFKRILNTVVDATHQYAYPRQRMWTLLGLSLAINLTSGLASRLIGLLDSLLGDRFTNHLSLKLMRHAASLDLAFFEDPSFYDKMDRARRQASSRLAMLTAVAGFIRQCITLVTMVSVVALSVPWLLVLLFAGTIPILWNETRFTLLNYSMLFRRTPERRRLDYVRYLGSSSHSAKEIKVFGLGNHLAERLRTLFEALYEENKQLSVRRAIYGAIISLVPTACHYAAYAFILFRALSGVMTVGDLGLRAIAFFRAGDIMEDLLVRLADISGQSLYVKDMFDYLETKPAIVSPPDALPAPRPVHSGFEFRNVSFSYAGSDAKVLDNISFRLPAGQRIALVGENGAGKTTLVKLLARLYDPTEGSILLDGRDLREYDVEDLRQQIGVIFQDYVRYDMLVAENIGFGRIEELGNQPRIEAAAEKSLAAGMISRFPGGYRQVLGRRFEEGRNLSTGQWQKLALARAYMRDGQILVLDEPTASLDAHAEYEVYRRFTEMTDGKMVVLISHRFSTVRMADHILVLSQGRIVEEGSHQELVAKGGRYAELFQFQAAAYR
jgi:ATP-binding cassette subfamily B protein